MHGDSGIRPVTDLEDEKNFEETVQRIDDDVNIDNILK